MKLTTFCVDTPVGAFDRFGTVRLDGGAEISFVGPGGGGMGH